MGNAFQFSHLICIFFSGLCPLVLSILLTPPFPGSVVLQKINIATNDAQQQNLRIAVHG